jgi:hypothetical protein
MKTTSVPILQPETGTGVSRVKSPRGRNRRRPHHWIILDTAWARLLGVRKTGGVYRIRANELQLKLFLLQQASSLQRSDVDRRGLDNDHRSAGHPEPPDSKSSVPRPSPAANGT